MSEIEHKTDESVHRILKKLNNTFVTPFDRDYIYDIAHQVDDCVDFMDDVSEIIAMYGIQTLPHRSKKVVKILQEAARLTTDVMPRLAKLSDIQGFWIQINSLENEADRLYRLTISDIFKNEKDPIEIIKLKELAETLESCADAFETLASTIETVAIQSS
jgi:uncharacterized protein Yka (UPF0111/DUF47 family)